VKDGKRILLVEDEDSIHQTVKLNLELENYRVASAYTGPEAVQKAAGARFDLIIMDVMLPDLDGHSAAESIRLSGNATPIIFLTAKDAPEDRRTGLRIGDDHLSKPFDLEELLLRVENLINRKRGDHEEEKVIIEFGKNNVNLQTFEAHGINEDSIQLSNRQAKLIRLLAAKEGQVVSRQEILEKAWGYDVFPNTRTIDNYILAFRKWFEEDPADPKHFLSVRGVGYRFIK
jgi:two-component system alkaline phosphatase synthesis response regulator PhoP